METTEKRPSAFATGAEILLFSANKQHSIPVAHHFNMVDFRGCSKSQFEKYLKFGHHLDEKAVLHMIKNQNLAALDIWFTYCKYQLNNETMELFAQTFGLEALLEKGVVLPPKLTSMLLVKYSADLALQHFNQLCFDENGASILLGLRNTALTVKFFKQQRLICEDLSPLILAYSDKEVYQAFFKYCIPLKGVREGVIKTKSPMIFKIMLESLTDPCTNDEVKLLIERGNLEMFRLYTQRFGLNEEMAAYVAEHSTDAIFSECVASGQFPYNSTALYEKLFKPLNRNLLLEFISKHSLDSGKWEIQLLKSGDSELIEAYKKAHNFSSEAAAYLLINNLGGEFAVSLKDITPLNWRAETLIFASDDDRLIEEYLFAGDAYSVGITEFGEAMLFRYGGIETLDAYMEDNTPCALAQRAMISRWNMAIISLFIHKHCYKFANEVAAFFLEKANASLAMQYLRSIENIEYFLGEESPESLHVLCQRKEPEFYQFVQDHIILDEESMILFIRNAPKKLVHELINKADDITLATEAEILRSNDKELILSYLKRRKELYAENESILIGLLDVDLIEFLGEDALVSAEAKELLAY